MTEYIKGIIFFLVFVSFIGIILPEGKYKNYINLVLGFIIMALVFKPMGDLGGIVGNISTQLSQQEIFDNVAYEDNYQMMIVNTVRSQMREQLSRAVDALGYRLITLNADINLDSGELKSINMTLENQESSSEINIAPITLFSGDDDPIDDIKKIVSDFYQLPEEHIYVIIHK